MPRTSNVGKYVSITWEDAWASDDYWTAKEITEASPLVIETVGYCIRDDKKCISVARTISAPEQYRCVHYIPRAMVRKVRVLR